MQVDWWWLEMQLQLLLLFIIIIIIIFAHFKEGQYLIHSVISQSQRCEGSSRLFYITFTIIFFVFNCYSWINNY